VRRREFETWPPVLGHFRFAKGDFIENKLAGEQHVLPARGSRMAARMSAMILASGASQFIARDGIRVGMVELLALRGVAPRSAVQLLERSRFMAPRSAR
jgi:hypothetical protein